MRKLSLKQCLDTIPKAHLDKTCVGEKMGYVTYNAVLNSNLTEKDYNDQAEKELEIINQKYKAEAGINHFKPEQLIATITENNLKLYFESMQINTFGNDLPNHQIINPTIITHKPIKSLLKIAHSLKADFLIYYKNISTGSISGLKNGIKIMAVLYSRKEHKILYQKETIAEIDKFG